MKAEKDFLVGCLTRAGIKSQVLKSWKELERYADSHVGAVLSEGQVLARDGSKRNYTDQSGVRCTRTCIYTVDSKFKVVIGDYTPERAESIFYAFLDEIDHGLHLDGNHVEIELGEVKWVEKDDSILKAEIACEIPVTFHGGYYKDVTRKPFPGINVNVGGESDG